MQPDAALKIFIIYAHEDRSFKDDLLKRLKLLRSQGLILPWHDRDLVAGDDWDSIIRGHMASADIILPIISIDFFNSDYIEQVEIVEAFQRYEQGKAHILPIIARQCRWEDDKRFAKLQVLPENGLPIAKWASADEAYDSVYDGIKAKIVDIHNNKAAEILKKQEAITAQKEAADKAVLEAEAQKKKQREASVKATVENTLLQVDPFADLMIHIKGGNFDMGDTIGGGEASEKPVHKVTLSDFQLCKYPVTQGHWKTIMGENPSWFRDDINLPVESVSWNDAQDFIKKLQEKTKKQYRLPTEAEWEYAAKGGSLSKVYQYAGSNDLKAVGWYAENAGSETHPVGQLAANELGLYDMSGNVWEWCQDSFGSYPKEAQTNPKGVGKGASRVIRGGSWDFSPLFCRTAIRVSEAPGVRSHDVGFRLALQ